MRMRRRSESQLFGESDVRNLCLITTVTAALLVHGEVVMIHLKLGATGPDVSAIGLALKLND